MEKYKLKFRISEKCFRFSRHAITYVSSRKRKNSKGIGESGMVRATTVICFLWMQIVLRHQYKLNKG